MGVQLGGLIKGRELEIRDLKNRLVAIDAFNTMFQFLTTIRDRETGEPLKDSKGSVTSHLSGLLYRTTKFIEGGIKPVYVFDGKRPDFKYVSAERKEKRDDARVRWKEAVDKGDSKEAFKQARMSASIDAEMIENAKKLLGYMGVPVIQAPSEGEAQCAWMCKEGKVWAAASQDWDAIIFGAPRLIRNLSITGKRRNFRTGSYYEVKPEMVESKDVLKELGINREQLIMMSMMIGTDFNPGVKGVGPKIALKKVIEFKTFGQLSKEYELPEEVYEFFLNPPHEDIKIASKEMNEDKIVKFMVDEHEFSQERIDNVIKRLKMNKPSSSSLSKWLK
ncbi:MAG: flap endonuclease-1 [Nanoarchaeota archaeon]|nr:flap endonuclease-1 [Nanoarchaeota archaeon]